jgi:hypothetical protein
VRDGQRAHLGAAQQLEHGVDGDGVFVIGAELGEVLAGQPEALGHALVPGQNHDPAGDPVQLGDAGGDVAPVVDGEQRHGGVGVAVGHGKALGAGLDGGSGAGRSLVDHDLRGLDGQHRLGRLV